MKSQLKMKTSIGDVYLVASQEALYGVYWEKQDVPYGKNAILAKAEKQVNEYLAGKRKLFDLPLSAEGTEFQKRVWKELSKIPYGKTISYTQLAAKIKKDRAVRAVGSANARNPLCLIVPCHRVIAANGGLGGYSGGLEAKRQLIDMERSN